MEGRRRNRQWRHPATEIVWNFYDTKFREEDYLEPNSVKGYYDSEGKLVIQGENDIVIKRDYDYWRIMDGLGNKTFMMLPLSGA